MAHDIYFTSDTHFRHANINKYSNRPFDNIEAMDEALIDNINAIVKPHDTLYHLGDFSFGEAESYRRAINCNKIVLIYGNHDKEIRHSPHIRNLFYSTHELLELKEFQTPIVLCHYAMRVWNRSHHGTWHLYGHSHGSLPDDPNSLSFDVGVDCCDYRPLSLDEVRQRMGAKTWKPVDHHGARPFEIERKKVTRY